MRSLRGDDMPPYFEGQFNSGPSFPLSKVDRSGAIGECRPKVRESGRSSAYVRAHTVWETQSCGRHPSPGRLTDPSLWERAGEPAGEGLYLKASGTWNVSTALRVLSETITFWFFTSRAIPRASFRIRFGPPIVSRAGTSPSSKTLHTPT